MIHLEELRDRIFCFGGEFGYELLSWLPYLKYVADESGVPLRTASRPGSAPLYSFSVHHEEHPFRWRPDGFGTSASDEYFIRAYGRSAVIPRNPTKKESGGLVVAGIPWEHRRIHERLTTTVYRPLEFPGRRAAFLETRSPIAIINNKDFDNWGNADPQLREAFSPADLEQLRDALHAVGYFVVYHRFDEAVPESRFELSDEGLFDGDGCLDMRDVYGGIEDAGARTEQQLALYRSADLAICPQGGNSFLPIMLGVPTLVLMKRVRLVEYQDLERVYGTRVDVHTSVRGILAAVRHDPELSAAR